MATRKKSYQPKSKKSKLSVIRNGVLWPIKSLSLAGCRIYRAVGAICQKILAFFRGMPRAMRILTIYALTVIVAVSIFLWRASQLHIAEPPIAEPPFDWSTYLPGEQSDPSTESPETPVETTAEGDNNELPDEGEPVSAEETVAEGPVFVKGEWPVKGELFYGFHETVIQNGLGYPLYYTSKGIAIKADRGSAVIAPWDGKVVKVNQLDKPHGQSVMLEHDHGLRSYLGALQAVSLQSGDTVVRGQPLGQVGSGFASEPDYLYLEIIKDGRVVNPVDYLLP